MKLLNALGVIAAIVIAVCLVAGRADAIRHRREARMAATAINEAETRALMCKHLARDIADLQLVHGNWDKDKWNTRYNYLQAQGIPVEAMGCDYRDGGCAIYNPDLKRIEIYPAFHRHCFNWDHFANR